MAPFPIIVEVNTYFKKLRCCECNGTWIIEHVDEAFKHVRKKHPKHMKVPEPWQFEKGLK